MEPDTPELKWQIDMATATTNIDRLERVQRLSLLDRKRQELSMAERMRAYAQGWMDRLQHDIAQLEAEEHRA